MNWTRTLRLGLGALIVCCGLTFKPADSFHKFWLEYPVWAAEENDPAQVLLQTISQALPRHTSYEETHVSTILSRPIVSQGTLSFTPPSRLEKHVRSPREERYIIDGDALHWEDLSSGKTRELFLPDYPLLQSFVEGFRAVFAGDLNTLQQWFDIEYQDTKGEWRLNLTPLDSGIGGYVEALIFFGHKETITMIEIQEIGGDYSQIQLFSKGK